jgi:hypothetical protein
LKAGGDKVVYHLMKIVNHRITICEEDVFGRKSKHHKSLIVLHKKLRQELCASASHRRHF